MIERVQGIARRQMERQSISIYRLSTVGEWEWLVLIVTSWPQDQTKVSETTTAGAPLIGSMYSALHSSVAFTQTKVIAKQSNSIIIEWNALELFNSLHTQKQVM